MSMQILDWLKKQKTSRHWTTVNISLLVTLYFTLAFNHLFIATVADGHGLHKPGDYFFMATAILILVLLINFIVSLFAFKYCFKAWLVILCIASSFASYFMQTYHIYIDSSMVQNTMETDIHEASALFSWQLVFQVSLLGVVPALVITQIQISYASFLKELMKKLIILVFSLLSIALVAKVFYQDYASVLRNNHHIRDLIVPMGYVYGVYSYTHDRFSVPVGITHTTGEDAHLGPTWNKSGKKVIAVIVVGETARADNFYLTGYGRDTNPNLKKQDIVYYNDFHSCGTATATSVPCMFSNMGRKNYAESVAKHSENLLDVIRHAGIAVLWRDNNSGCKGVCDRVDYDDVGHLGVADLCNTDECFDMVLLHNLQEKIMSYKNRDLVIVLHQKGSHGPDYYKRAPADFQVFQPVCHTNRMIECTRPEITNAYDNTILYTDYVLSKTIDFLKEHDKEYDSSLFYVSDHGESLGENNLYLHGMPYSIAPEQQTHVPALFWLSNGFADRFNIDKKCLIQHESGNYSQDNLFHSTLGLLDIKTTAYDPSLDMFKVCKSPH